MHELAVTSGFAAAYRLGADYPFKGDDDCQRLFVLYLALSHGVRMVSLMAGFAVTAHNVFPAQRRSERHPGLSSWVLPPL